MDFINKKINLVKLSKDIKSTISNVLPGNPVTREYEVIRHTCSAGPGLLWKVYDGIKKSTKQEASIFVFEKKLIERYGKREQDLVIDTFKKGVSQLTKLRHPRLLIIQHPMEESRESLAFATEPVVLSLANALGKHDNMPLPLPADLKDYKLFDVEIKYGLMQLSEAFVFLHSNVKLLHRNLCPESIVISKSGAWKLTGFEFSQNSQNSADQPGLFSHLEWREDCNPNNQPNLNYLAPEYIFGERREGQCSAASDMYSLGQLIYAIYNMGQPLYDNCASIPTYKRNMSQLSSISVNTLVNIPDELREYVKMLLNTNAELRPDAHQISKIQFFQDGGVKTLEYLDSLFQVDNLQKSQFFRGLPRVLQQFPKRVNLYRIFPCLSKELVNADMVPFLLPSIFIIMNQSTSQECAVNILPDLKPVFRLQEPIQVLLLFMQNMDLLLHKTPSEDIKNHVLPMIYRALEASQPQIQELCLNIIPTFAHMVDYPSMKNAVLPRLKKICVNSRSVGLNVNTLVCIGKLLEHFDKWLVLDSVLPMLQCIKSREPAILMAMLGIYKMALNHKKLGITKEILATNVLPALFPLSIENNLSLSQFNAYMSLIREMMQRVEDEQRSKLEQLDSIKQEHSSALHMATNIGQNSNSTLITGVQKPASTEMEEIFSSFGLSTYLDGKSAEDVNKSLTVKPTAAVNAATSATIQNTQAKPEPLSIEEKQKMMREQETGNRLKSQAQLTPARSVGSSAAKAPTKDLTTSLITSNLNSMNSPVGGSYNLGMSTATNVSGMTTVGNNMSGMSTMGMSGMSAMGSSMPRMSPMGGNVPAASAGITPINSNASGIGRFHSPSMSSISSPMASTQAANKTIDMSAFDDLLSPMTSKATTLSRQQSSMAQQHLRYQAPQTVQFMQANPFAMPSIPPPVLTQAPNTTTSQGQANTNTSLDDLLG